MNQALSVNNRRAETAELPSAAARPGLGDGLLVIDMQRDFLTGGSLPVPQGTEILPRVNAWIQRFMRAGLPIFASRDWHPKRHVSFRERGGPWPEHCVAGTPGAAFAPGLQLPPATIVISKGCAADAEAYSAFEGTELQQALRQHAVRRLFIAGLALEYCVQSTVLDALRCGFGVWLLSDAIAALDSRPGDAQRAMQKMLDAGALIGGEASDTAQAEARSKASASERRPVEIKTG